MAGYGVRAFLIAQSLNQIEKAYGEHNRSSTTATSAWPLRPMTSARLAGSPTLWAGDRAARDAQLCWPPARALARTRHGQPSGDRAPAADGEVMQLPSTEELVMVAGLAPIRAAKLRYYEDSTFTARVLPPPALGATRYADAPPPRSNDWGCLARRPDARLARAEDDQSTAEDGGLQQERHPGIEPAPVKPEPPSSSIFPISSATTPTPPPTSVRWTAFARRWCVPMP
jgi:type IV secretion system protein VirD4